MKLIKVHLTGNFPFDDTVIWQGAKECGWQSRVKPKSENRKWSKIDINASNLLLNYALHIKMMKLLFCMLVHKKSMLWKINNFT